MILRLADGGTSSGKIRVKKIIPSSGMVVYNLAGEPIPLASKASRKKKREERKQRREEKREARHEKKEQKRQIKIKKKVGKKAARAERKHIRQENKTARVRSRQERRSNRVTEKQARKEAKREAKVQRQKNKLVRAKGRQAIIEARQQSKIDKYTSPDTTDTQQATPDSSGDYNIPDNTSYDNSYGGYQSTQQATPDNNGDYDNSGSSYYSDYEVMPDDNGDYDESGSAYYSDQDQTMNDLAAGGLIGTAFNAIKGAAQGIIQQGKGAIQNKLQNAQQLSPYYNKYMLEVQKNQSLKTGLIITGVASAILVGSSLFYAATKK